METEIIAEFIKNSILGFMLFIVWKSHQKLVSQVMLNNDKQISDIMVITSSTLDKFDKKNDKLIEMIMTKHTESIEQLNDGFSGLAEAIKKHHAEISRCKEILESIKHAADK